MADGSDITGGQGFFAELKRRRVIRVAIVYAVVGWVVVEVASTVLPPLNVPDWSVKLVIVLVALGFPIAVIMGWMFDRGPDAVTRTGPPPAAPAREAVAVTADLPRQHAVTAGADHIAAAPPSGEGRRTIAVLPFVNMSGDAENEYFSDGISEEILNLLAKLPQLKVSSRTSSFNLKGEKVDIPTAARQLGVDTILEGSVRRAGDRVRITAQLIETAGDSHLWSETYDREIKDVFAIQDDIARSIADALQVALGPKERRALQNVATADVHAYDFYLRGRRYFYAMTRRDFLHAIQMYEQAIGIDPQYALAYAGIADAYSFLYRYSSAMPENIAQAEKASLRAVELDPDSAEAHAARGTALTLGGQYPKAEKHFETAMLLNPNLFESYFFYGRACMSAGNVEKAARLFMRAAEVNPSDYRTLGFLSQAYEAMGRTDSARESLVRAKAILEQHLRMNPDDSPALCFGGAILAQLGDREQAIAWTERALDAAGSEAFIVYNSACTFARLGVTDRAFELLERALAQGWGDRTWIEHDSDLASLHGDPRFDRILQQLS